MKRKHWLAFLLFFVLLLSGCSQQEKQQTSTATTVVATRPPQSGAATRPPQTEEEEASNQAGVTETAASTQVEDSGVDGGVSWSISQYGDGYVLYVTGSSVPDRWASSVLRFTNKDSSGNNILGQIKRVVVADEVTAIGERAFAGCAALEDVTLGKNVATMGNQVFFGCQNLYQVQFTGTNVPPAALKANTAVQYVQLSAECVAIGDEAFSGCTALQSVDGTTSALVQVGSSAFSKCTALGAVPELSGLRILGDYAFAECTAIRSVSIPQTLTSLLGNYAFQGCSALREITFPQRGDMLIGSNAFENCTALTRVELTAAVYAVERAAFRGCTGLIELTVGGQSSLGKEMLSGCSNVTVTVVGSLPVEAFKDSAAVVKASFEGNNVIPARAFSGCTALKELSFLEQAPVKIIGEEAFGGCTALKEVVLCSGLEELGSRAFADCTNMTAITIPRTLTKIGSSVFANVSGFSESSKGIRYEGSSAEWGKVDKPAQRTGVSWNAGITPNGDTAEPVITYLNRK